jgi:hypothetical protein
MSRRPRLRNNNIINLQELRGLPAPFIKTLGRIGLNWIPPLNADIRVLAPVVRQLQLPRYTTAAAPANFSWSNGEDIANRFECSVQDLALAEYTVDPPDQGACGSCWAVSTAGVHTDRHRIFTQIAVPPLSSTYILACSKGRSLGCNGGYATEAANFSCGTGLVPEQCYPYDWCAGSAQCRNSMIPDCQSSGCSSDGSGDDTKYKGISGSTRTLADPEDIRSEIWQSGPVVAQYFVMGDFPNPPPGKRNLWEETDGIYFHDADQNIYGGTVSAVACGETKGSPSGGKIDSSKCMMGGHAVAIIGYGSQAISSINDGAPINYWLVRNSWGRAWNGDGYFKIAWTGKYQYKPAGGGQATTLNANQDIGFDHIITELWGKRLGGQFGGCVTWQITKDQINPCTGNPAEPVSPPPDEPDDNGDDEPEPWEPVSPPDDPDKPDEPVEPEPEPEPDEPEPEPSEPCPAPEPPRSIWDTLCAFLKGNGNRDSKSAKKIGACVIEQGQCIHLPVDQCRGGKYYEGQTCRDVFGKIKDNGAPSKPSRTNGDNGNIGIIIAVAVIGVIVVIVAAVVFFAWTGGSKATPQSVAPPNPAPPAPPAPPASAVSAVSAAAPTTVSSFYAPTPSSPLSSSSYYGIFGD